MTTWHQGSCHCHRVTFEVFSDCDKALTCNCSICLMKGYLHLIVPAEDFRLTSGQAHLSTYQFNTKTACHHFCNQCGVAPFYVPRSHPDGFDVNLRCVKGVDWSKVSLTPFNGADWEAHIQQIQGYHS